MKRQLLILRHGHAKNNAPNGDFFRDLKDKGKRNAQRIGIWLAQNDLRPDAVIASPAVRAKRTAEKCVKTSGLNANMVEFRDGLYEASFGAVIKMIRDCRDDVKRLMIVGHNPSLSMVSSMLGGQMIAQSPASLVCLDVHGPWQELDEDICSLKKVVLPESLPELFPFPDLNGPNERIRPAYYYRQSSVVPYRVMDGDLQVLIITSSKNRHWVVPKGIHDPGLTAQESAAKEAMEEAGVLGTVAEEEMGTYQYEKWDAHCDVAVYPMEVTKVLSDDLWEENHRMRQWVPLEKAVELIDNRDLALVVSKLKGFVR